MAANSPLTIIGRAERIELLDYGRMPIPAKVDTGADSSSIWATNIAVEDELLSFTLFGTRSPYFTGEVITLEKGNYRQTRIANSLGQKERRYAVKLRVRINGKIVNATFTLADRSLKTYPILIGRKLLKNRFLVDVAAGDPPVIEEQRKKKILRVELGLDED